MNIVVSLFAHENDEKLVIRFKKIPADDSSEFEARNSGRLSSCLRNETKFD
jgi:hypothetical protein